MHTTKLMKLVARIEPAAGGGYRFLVAGPDGLLVHTSERYTRKTSAIRGLKRLFPRAKVAA